MCFLHMHSNECLKSELDLFSLARKLVSRVQWIHYKSNLTVDDSPIEFVIPGQEKDAYRFIYSAHIRLIRLLSRLLPNNIWTLSSLNKTLLCSSILVMYRDGWIRNWLIQKQRFLNENKIRRIQYFCKPKTNTDIFHDDLIRM